MWRFLAGVASTLLLVTAGFFLWRGLASDKAPIPPAPTEQSTPFGFADLAPPPAADERTKEQKRFGRYDKDKNGLISGAEYFITRQKNFAKLDLNGDGRLGFDEYVVKARGKFGAADRDQSGGLNAVEFATTRVIRKPKPKCACPQPRSVVALPPEGGEGDDEG